MALLETDDVPKESRVRVGSVVSLWRYPVKSMIGEEIDSSYITERGVLGDRVYAVVDRVTGKVASAKNPKKWGRLLDFRASFINPPGVVETMPAVRVTFPDGRSIASDQHEIHTLLSEALGAQVSIVSSSLERPSYDEYWPDMEGLANREKVTEEVMPPRTFFDLEIIHMLTTATLDRLHELYPEGRFDMRRFRPNIVIEPSAPVRDFIENEWVHRAVHIGEDVRMKITRPCTRCVMTTLPQGDLPADLGILRTAVRYNQIKVGVYASVERGGYVKEGDPVWIE